MADTLTNELLLEILSGNANSPRPVELGEIERLTPELLASLRGLARKTMQDRDKLKFYKESFSTLTTHLNLLTARLTTAETGLQAQTTEFARQAQKNSEEVDAFRTLSKVWENRWREERREKEELESMLYAQDTTSLNRSTARDQAGITIHRSPIKPTKGRRRSPSSSSSSSSESRRDPSRSLIVASGSTRSTTRLSSKQVIADLSRELERVRRDGESLLRERDDQIDRLQHERQLRKTELKDVYLSFDTLLGLGGAVALNTPANLLVSEETTPRPKPVKVKSGRSARLKAEVQEMEQEVARLLSLKQTPPSPREQLLLSSTLQVLEYDIAQLQADLREGLHERDVLRKRLFGSANHIGTSSVAALDSTTDSRRTAKLEDANERLLAQLTATTREAAALQARLDETETTFDGIADRVRETMIKRQDDLRDASSRILLLEERLAENANRL